MTGDRIVVVGDLINDIVATPLGPIRPDTDTSATIRPRPGGSAANTAAWLGSLGAPVDYVGAAGSHDAAEHERILRDSGVVPHLQIEYGVPTGSIVIIVQGDERSMFTERGANALLSSSMVTAELLAEACVLHLSAYSFLDGFGIPGARDVVDRATEAGVAVAMNPGSAGYIRDFGADDFLEAASGASILFPNLAEGELLTDETDPERIVDALLERFPTVVLTRGADGSTAKTRGSASVSVPAPKARRIDPTGAGDAFAAGFLHRWMTDPDDLESALQSGSLVAARAVMVTGGRPPV